MKTAEIIETHNIEETENSDLKELLEHNVEWDSFENFYNGNYSGTWYRTDEIKGLGLALIYIGETDYVYIDDAALDVIASEGLYN